MPLPSHRDGKAEAVFRLRRIRPWRKPVGCRLKQKKRHWQKPVMKKTQYLVKQQIVIPNFLISLPVPTAQVGQEFIIVHQKGQPILPHSLR